MSKERDIKSAQYRSYVLKKIQVGIDRTAKEGVLSQAEVELRLSKFINNKA